MWRWILRSTICGCVLVALCVPLFWNSIEIQFRLNELAKLHGRTLISTDGYQMDVSVEEAQSHRVRLVGLGRFFHKSYRVFDGVAEQFNREEIRSLISYLDRRFPGVFWELSNDGRLDVWDDVANEAVWDLEVSNGNWRL